MNLILDNHKLGDGFAYGLKLNNREILLPSNSRHTRYYFAKTRQEQIIIELAKRISNGWACRGSWALIAIKKINQCSRICEHYITNT